MLRVTTRLIEVNVVVQDKKGEPVRDLTRDDFTLLDNGKKQPLSVFALNTAQAAPAALPPGTYTNRPEGRSQAGSLSVILLDGLNTSFEDQTWSRSEVTRFLEQLQPQDRVAIYLLGEHLAVAQDFTSDSRTLLTVVRRLEGRVARELAGSTTAMPATVNDTAIGPMTGLDSVSNQSSTVGTVGPGSSGAGQSAGLAAAAAAQAREEALFAQWIEERETAFFSVDRVRRTLDALVAIANHLASFPGRKNLIWVSASFPIQIGMLTPRAPGDTRTQQQFGPELERAARALNNANLAVYPVDARGLVAGGASNGTTPASGRGVAGEGVRDPEQLFSTQGVMDALADSTGGRAFYNTNDLPRAIRSALDDSEVSYTLGFYPSNIKWDGKFHQIKVQVDRPGARLRYRQGYFALYAGPTDEQQSKAALSQAIRSPLDASTLGVTIAMEKAGNRGKLRITVDAHDVSFQNEKDGVKAVTLDFLVAEFAADGKIKSNVLHTVHMGVAAKGFEQVLRNGLALILSLDLEEGATELRLVVRDTATGNLGSVSVPLGP
ncbi:MAG TPA: VWA domain-containing protein [Terriglobia bacterium]|nr:VWA domain-containing protein [Terriglobia bacterium]